MAFDQNRESGVIVLLDEALQQIVVGTCAAGLHGGDLAQLLHYTVE
jgi:hypothetical protein